MLLLCSYGVAAVVNDVVSEPTAWSEVVVPPRQGSNHEPRLVLLESANDSLALNINPAPANIKCEVNINNNVVTLCFTKKISFFVVYLYMNFLL